jgi:hypothetical protein
LIGHFVFSQDGLHFRRSSTFFLSAPADARNTVMRLSVQARTVQVQPENSSLPRIFPLFRRAKINDSAIKSRQAPAPPLFTGSVTI